MCGFFNRFNGKDDEFSVLCRMLKEQTLKQAKDVYDEDHAQGSISPWANGYGFWFVSANKIRNSEGPLPVHQRLRREDGWLAKKTVNYETITKQDFCKTHAAMSYV